MNCFSNFTQVAASAKKPIKELRECYEKCHPNRDDVTTTTLTSSSAPQEAKPPPTRSPPPTRHFLHAACRLFRFVSPSSSQLKVPDQLAVQIADFALRHTSAASVAAIQGGRKAVRMEGKGSAEWFVSRQHASIIILHKRRKLASRKVKTYESFIAAARNAVILEAAKIWPDATAISLSKDIVSY
jgi:hypothetical protein